MNKYFYFDNLLYIYMDIDFVRFNKGFICSHIKKIERG